MVFNQVGKGAENKQTEILEFFIELGREFYKLSKHKKNISLCLSVPRIEFISSLISLGLVDALYSDSEIIQAEFSTIKKNTLVLYKRAKEITEEAQIFVGFDEDKYPVLKSSHRPPVITTVKKDNWKELIRIAPDQKKYKTNQSFKNGDYKTLCDFYSPNIISSLLNKPIIRILMVTVKTRLKEELNEKIHHDYKFRDWLLPKSFSGAQAPFIVEIVNCNTEEKDISISEDTIIIYDGANSYYKSPLRTLKNPEIIILDRNSSFELLNNVAEEIYEFEDASLKDFLEFNSSKIMPKGIEMIAWKRGEV